MAASKIQPPESKLVTLTWQDRIDRAKKSGSFTDGEKEAVSYLGFRPAAEFYGLPKTAVLSDLLRVSGIALEVFDYDVFFRNAVLNDDAKDAQVQYDIIKEFHDVDTLQARLRSKRMKASK